MQNPFLSQDFYIRWSTHTVDAMEPDIECALKNAAENIAKIRTRKTGEISFRNTVLEFETALRELGIAWGKIDHLNSVNNTPALREVYGRLLPKVTAFMTGITLDAELWRVIKTFAGTPEAAALGGIEKRLLAEICADFSENGADLPPEKKKRLEFLNEELAKLTQKFGENVLDATNAWEKIVSEKQLLDGLPASALDAASASAKAKGASGFRFTLHAPSITPVLQYAKSEKLRQECWEAGANIGNVAPHDNTALIREILALRHEKAQLLGKKNFADFATARRMARSGDNALRFVENLHARIQEFFEKETAALEQFKAAKTGAPATPLAPWELAFWAEAQRREKYDFDPEALRPYLPATGIVAGMFDIFGKLFGFRVVERDTVFTDLETGKTETRKIAGSTGAPVEVWHPEVRFYELFDAGTQKHLGSFYTDWHPRESKRGGAWMNHLFTGRRLPDGTFTPHLGLMVGNFTAGIAGRDALLTHDEALTIFHEFGHLLHQLLSEVPYESLSGTRVAWDFVELPSQILENWCRQKDALDRFARHHETGETLPPALLEKLLKTANYRAACASMRQFSFAKLDLELHVNYEKHKDCDLDKFWNETLAPYQIRTASPAPSGARKFLHIFSEPTGYAAGYYSYKWAEVLEADAFTRFLKEGIFNEKTGGELRAKILAKGNSAPAEELFRDFMGRDPDPNALLEREELT